jgi:hypothetical protein
MVVKYETSNLKTLEFDHILCSELAHIQEPTNIRLDSCEVGICICVRY